MARLNGYPIGIRLGFFLQSVTSSDDGRPKDDEAMTRSGRVLASMVAKRERLMLRRSGAFCLLFNFELQEK